MRRDGDPGPLPAAPADIPAPDTEAEMLADPDEEDAIVPDDAAACCESRNRRQIRTYTSSSPFTNVLPAMKNRGATMNFSGSEQGVSTRQTHHCREEIAASPAECLLAALQAETKASASTESEDKRQMDAHPAAS